MPFCKNCGAHYAEGTGTCGNCGSALESAISPSVAGLRKSASVALLLAGLVGVLFMGVGHFYLRRMGRGVVFLLSGILTGILFFVAMVGAFFTIGIAFGIVRLSIWIWQMRDALKLTKRYNDVLETTGKAPW